MAFTIQYLLADSAQRASLSDVQRQAAFEHICISVNKEHTTETSIVEVALSDVTLRSKGVMYCKPTTIIIQQTKSTNYNASRCRQIVANNVTKM